MSDSTGPSRARHRLRSTRAVLAGASVLLGAGLVLAATLRGEAAWLSGAAAASVLLGALAARLVWYEVRATRQAAAYDRARQAERFSAESLARSAEHTVVVAALSRRLDHGRRELGAAYAEAAGARRLAGSYRRQADGLREQVRSLEEALVAQQTAAAQLAEQGQEITPEGVVRLSAWAAGGGRRPA
ncbi:hypothetical protein KLP28_09020 [Nocardioidaceae bacterium]|nr:hypothetical protein KLP28_09020 [Nocardioidaceae bacterium]